MIEKELVRQIVEEFIKDKNYYIVDINVSNNNSILVEIDSIDGVLIDKCVELSKFIESRIDREIEDYELEVGSPGLSTPFKVIEQYRKYAVREVEVLPIGTTRVQCLVLSVP